MAHGRDEHDWSWWQAWKDSTARNADTGDAQPTRDRHGPDRADTGRSGKGDVGQGESGEATEWSAKQWKAAKADYELQQRIHEENQAAWDAWNGRGTCPCGDPRCPG
jgi:hypothetical protein